MRLASFTHGRANNFNLIRILAALAVLISHSFALAIGSSYAEPFKLSLGMTMGSMAVDIFFITSGFLVTGSLFNRQSAIEFFWARVLRIIPGLFLMVILTVFIVGVCFTTHSLSDYLTDKNTYIFLIKNITIVTNISASWNSSLPGVFLENPYKSAVNGSLWTLPYEISMYSLLVFLWITFNSFDKLKLILIALAVGALVYIVYEHFYHYAEIRFVKLFFMFFSGASYYVLRRHIKISRLLFYLFLALLILSASINKDIFFIVYTLTIAYILFYFVYIPSGMIRKYNLLGDYSYGVYIYAFTVQQCIAALIPGVSVFVMLLLSSIATFILAILSWHLVESRALMLKVFFVNYTKAIFKVASLR